MISKHYSKMALVALAAASLFFAGCGGKNDATSNSQKMMDAKQAKAAADAAAVAAGSSSESATMAAKNMKQKPSTNSVYFAFDSANIDDAGHMILVEYAAWLNANADISVTVEGHCDYRGSKEYNLALGDQRANVVRDVLIANGVDGARVGTSSFGEERAVCTDVLPGKEFPGEACLAQNRHGDVVNR